METSRRKKDRAPAGSVLRSTVFLMGLLAIGTAVGQSHNPQCEALSNVDLDMERRCLCADDTERRLQLLNGLLGIQKNMDQHGCDQVRSHDDLCGGFLDIATTYIEIRGCEESLDIGETCLLEDTVKSLGCADSGANCECEGPLQEVELLGLTTYESLDPAIATVDPVLGKVTGHFPGEATIIVTLDSWAEIYGEKTIRVGEGNSADIVFVVSNGMDQYGRFPPDGWYLFPPNAGFFFDQAALEFDDFDLSLVVFNCNRCRGDPQYWCGLATEGCYTDRTVIPLGLDVLTRADWQAGWDSISIVCDWPVDDNDLGSGQYSALLHALSTSDWDYTKDNRAIFLLPAEPACFWPDTGGCTTEPVSGITRESIIQLATTLDVKIFSINWNAPHEWASGCTGQTQERWLFLREDLNALSSETGGIYFDADVGFCVEYPLPEDVIQEAMIFLSGMTDQ